MRRLPPSIRGTTARELGNALERDGFVLDRQKGSHRIYRHPVDHRRAVLPYPSPSATIPYGTIKAIIEDAGWTLADLECLKLI